MSENLNSLYRDIIMDHYRYPRGKKHLEQASIKGEGKNPTCGDEIEMELKIDHDKVEDLSIICKGCAISVASGSILSEIIKGKSLDEVKKIAGIVKSMLKGGQDDGSDGMSLGDLEALKGVKDFPVRIKCALLSWSTLMDSLKSWEDRGNIKISSTE